MSTLTRVGHYELVRPLGAGGMAQTFVAVRRGPAGFEQKVCLKRILPNRAADRLLVEQFLDEARLLARLRHTGIVQVYDFGEVEGSYFMALELVEGVDLECLLASLGGKKQLPLAVCLLISAQVLSALHYAHGAELDGEPLHIVHRDISPSNILLSCQGEVKLADFGIAKSSHRSHKTQTGFTKGKIAYMSPEQVRGEALDARSDLFAVGVVLHEMLTGVHPFDAPTDLTILGNILSGTRPPLRSLVPELHADVAALVNALLATDAAMRPRSAADALRLIPGSEQAFATQRVLAELVQSHAPQRVPASRPSPPRAEPLDLSTAPVAHAPTQRAEPPRLGGARAQPTSGFESSPTDRHELLDGRRRGGRGAWAFSLTVLAIAVGAWLGYRHLVARESPFVLPTPLPSSGYGATDASAREATPLRPPEAPRAAPLERARDAPEPDPGVDPEQNEREGDALEHAERTERPLILHAPHSELPHRSASPVRKPARVMRRAARTEAPPPAQYTAPEPAASEPPAAEKKAKHRTGGSLSTEEF